MHTQQGDNVKSPTHYTWIGDAITQNGGPAATRDLESWDLLDAIAGDNPHVWNALKYLTRLGKKGGAEKRLEDLKKARTYLDRAISKEQHAK